MDELKANLENSNKNLEKLVIDIQGMSDAESEFSELRDNLGEAAQALSKNAGKYEEFLIELKESNVKFSDTLNTLKSLEPKEIKDRLDDLLKITFFSSNNGFNHFRDTKFLSRITRNSCFTICTCFIKFFTIRIVIFNIHFFQCGVNAPNITL